jgi:hypothetical protein
LLDSPLFPADSELSVNDPLRSPKQFAKKEEKKTKTKKTFKQVQVQMQEKGSPLSPVSHRHSLTDTLKNLIPESKPHISKTFAKVLSSQLAGPNCVVIIVVDVVDVANEQKPETSAVTALHGQVADLTARVVELDRTQTHMATRLERIIFSMHNGFVDKKYVSIAGRIANVIPLVDLQCLWELMHVYLSSTSLPGTCCRRTREWTRCCWPSPS